MTTLHSYLRIFASLQAKYYLHLTKDLFTEIMSYKDDIEKFAIRIKNGESMETPEDLQFYLKHRNDIEKLLKYFSGKHNIFKWNFFRMSSYFE